MLRGGWRRPCWMLREVRHRDDPLGRQRLEYGAQVRQDAQLAQDHAGLRVAVELLDLAVNEREHVTAWSVHALPGRRQHAEGEMERPVVCALQCKLDRNDVTA